MDESLLSFSSDSSGEDPRRLRRGSRLLGGEDVPFHIHVAPLADVEETAVAAAALGLVEGLVGEEDQLGAGLDVEVGEGGDAGAQGGGGPLPLDLEAERLDRLPEALGDRQALLA